MTNGLKETIEKEIRKSQAELEEVEKEIQHCEENINQDLDKGGVISPDTVDWWEKLPELRKRREEILSLIGRLREHLVTIMSTKETTPLD